VRDRIEPGLKILSAILGILLLARLGSAVMPGDPLAEVKVPSLKSIAPKEEADADKSKSGSPSRSRSSSRSSRPKLPPVVDARVNAVFKSEIFGPIPRPLPMELQGIIGADAILRGTNGQTKLVSVGEVVGGVKLLKIGINRAIVEVDGKEKELTLHSGYGSESLLTKERKP
jgi:hypothetical protein